ncbi:MAG: T9SS type A sorting domain-containing protein [Bacteroidota bacterium]
MIDPLTGTQISWAFDPNPSRAPTEAPDFDYFTFYAIGIQALPFNASGEETLFSFTYTGNCISYEAAGIGVSIIDNDNDPFSPIAIGGNNSENLNATNYLDPLGASLFMFVPNAFVGSYLDGSRDCSVNFPVEWLDFTATPAGSVVDIEWATAIEAGNKFFSVERSVDGRLFQEIMRVPGQGNSNEVTTYKEVDTDPVPGYSYYRLRQVDFDAGFSYSEVVEVFFDPKAVKLGIQVYPNPTRQVDGFNVEFDSQEEQYLYLELYTSNGQMVYKKLVEANRGRNEHKVPTDGLSTGVYHLRLFNDQQTESTQVIVK